MAVLTREEFFARLHDKFGADSSDEAIGFIEDMTDTYNQLETSAKADGQNWEQRYKELDESWKAKYRHRFFNGGDREVPVTPSERRSNEPEYDPDIVTYDSLFKG